ncbi:hypothetical protein [Chondrinema litorale]|uniref:hypothetical protein n=1 Tax=Chondrinema litorale TaxID=2994555 RepID=UPI002542CBE7|nr:hypothetical protein [Chondrinema litorale]UZR99481.1 hypothetical protein OQ292_36425 [Chondrinema litorale]
MTITLIKALKIVRSTFQLVGLIFSILVGSSSLFFGERFIEKFDWRFYKNERQEIVNRVLKEEHKENIVHLDYFLPISNVSLP